MQNVFVLSSDRKPLDPCHPARARQMLAAGRAAVLRRYPFTIILKDRTAAESVTRPHAVKLDPGSRATGLAVTDEQGRVVWAGELHHRGKAIKASLDSRRAIRRSRRNRQTRYRPARFNNRRKPEGWLAPSLQHRVETTETWLKRLRRVCPVAQLSVELAKFDPQRMANPEISGVEYQQGELQGYEVREYLLEKWDRRCAYCGETDLPLQVEHIVPKSRGGTDQVSNLTLACRKCNQTKGNKTAAEFGYPDVQAKATKPLHDAAAVNTTRWALYRRLQATGLPVEAGTGAQTKFNRAQLGLPKAHWIDAACVGESGEHARVDLKLVPLAIRATGHGTRQMCRTDTYGFPRTSPKGARRVFGFKTGDVVKAIVPGGKRAGTHVGRVAGRASGSFRVGGADGISHRHCRLLHRADGYEYTKGDRALPPAAEAAGFRARKL